MYKHHSISLIFPAYNEEENIAQAVKDFKSLKIIDEIIVVDNNSVDRTASLAKTAGAIVVKEKKQGYGFALQKGLQKATGDYVVLCEPDGTFSSADLKRMLNLLDQFDLVIGTRTNSDYIFPGAHMHGPLKWANWLLARYMSLLYRTPSLSDCGCTYRAFRHELVKKMLPHLTVGHSHFLPETVIISSLYQAKIKEIPIHFYPRIGQSKITGSLRRAILVGLSMWWLITSSLWQKRQFHQQKF